MQCEYKNEKCVKTRITAAMLVCIAACAFGQAQQESELDQGLRYVRGLQERYFLDIADEVLQDLVAKFPEAGARAAQLELEGDLTRGKFDEVKARIAAAEKKGEKEDVLWAMKLALADSYFAYTKNDEARAIYEGFFKKYKTSTTDKKGNTTVKVPESLEAFYTNAAYKYAQMLLRMKLQEPALAMYKDLIAMGTLPKHIMRQCMAECAEIALNIADETKDAKKQRELCSYVDGLANKLLWEQDLWFGKAIVLKAHAFMLLDKTEEAQELVDRYMPTLTMIHQALVDQEAETGEPLTRVSPMSECRYLLAVMLYEKAQSIMDSEEFNMSNPEQREKVLSLLLGAKKNGKRKGDGAYNHFVNVYMKYPESTWAADAGVQSERVREILVDKFGGNVKSNVTPEQEAKVRTIQYKDAQVAYAQGNFEEAKKRTIQVLNSYPDAPESITALGNLARCYMADIVKTGDEAVIYADAVIGHLAERYCRDETMGVAGDMLISLAERWGEYDRDDLRLSVYSKFFRNFPKHPACVSYLFMFAEKAYQDKDYAHALEYFGIIAENYPNSPRCIDALSRIASIYEEQNDYEKMMPVLDAMLARLGKAERPVHAYYTTRFRKSKSLHTMATDVIKSGTTNEVELKAATRNLALAIKAYDELAKDLEKVPSSAQVNDFEKEQNTKFRLNSLLGKAVALATYPTDKPEIKDKFREQAIKSNEELVAAFPESAEAPKALIQIGTLYTIMKKVEEAEAALSRLRKEYPNSDEAKSALPLMADNLMKLDMREEAIARYREMFASSGTEYSDYDILRAVNALMDAKEFELARVGIDKIASKEDSPVAAQARFAECKLLMAEKSYEPALNKLVAFTNSFPRTSLVLDAYLLMSESASKAGLTEKDADRRLDFFNTAVRTMKDVQKRRTNDVEVAQCDIDVGMIMINKSKAEEQFGDKAMAEDYRGKALISLIGFLESSNSRKPQLQQLVEKTYHDVIPLLMEHKQWEMVTDNCMAYLERFPQGRYVSQVNAWNNQAKIELDTAN